MMDINIKQFENLLIKKQLRSNNISVDNLMDTDIDSKESDMDNEENRMKFINEINSKFKLKNLTNAMEQKIWQDEYDIEDKYGKALMMARRSSKCMDRKRF